MPECAYIERCFYFNDLLPDLPDLNNSVEKKYCRGEPVCCPFYHENKVLC